MQHALCKNCLLFVRITTSKVSFTWPSNLAVFNKSCKHNCLSDYKHAYYARNFAMYAQNLAWYVRNLYQLGESVESVILKWWLNCAKTWCFSLWNVQIMHNNVQCYHKYMLYHEKLINEYSPTANPRPPSCLFYHFFSFDTSQPFKLGINVIYSSNSDFLLLFMSCICWLNFCCSSNLFSFLLFHSATNTSIQNINVSSCTKTTKTTKTAKNSGIGTIAKQA